MKPVKPKCEHTDCFANIFGYCESLLEAEKKCPFFKTRTTLVLEDGALSRKTKSGRADPDWTMYRRHSMTKAVTAKQIADWLAKLDELEPSTDRKTRETMQRFYDSMHREKITAGKLITWFREHPDRCNWTMDPVETVQSIIDGTDDEEPEKKVSEGHEWEYL